MAQGDDTGLVAVVLILFPFAFALLWVGVIAIIAQFGWGRFARWYAAGISTPAGAPDLRWQTLRMGTWPWAANYGNCVNAWLRDDGLYLRPALPFRMFHPTLRLRWGDFKSVEPGKLLWRPRVQLRVRHDLPPLDLFGRLGEAVHTEWRRRDAPNHKARP